MAASRRGSALFVYGSLLDQSLRERLLRRRVRSVRAILPDYQRCRGRYFYVTRRRGARTKGAILLGLSPEDLAILDRYEDVPRLYVRRRVAALAPRGPLRCWLYVPTATLLRARAKKPRRKASTRA